MCEKNVHVVFRGKERYATKKENGLYAVHLEMGDYYAVESEIQEIDYKKAYETLQGVYDQLHKDYEALEHSYRLRGRTIADLKEELNQQAEHNLKSGNTSLFF